jgi:hypothetical protein
MHFVQYIPDQPLHIILYILYNIYIHNNNNDLLTASGLSPGGSGYFTFKLRQTY